MYRCEATLLAKQFFILTSHYVGLVEQSNITQIQLIYTDIWQGFYLIIVEICQLLQLGGSFKILFEFSTYSFKIHSKRKLPETGFIG